MYIHKRCSPDNSDHEEHVFIILSNHPWWEACARFAKYNVFRCDVVWLGMVICKTDNFSLIFLLFSFTKVL